ncbi:MAG TPA: hypothetical protein VLL54_06130 [Pyrinomonadaceae bacterium]|nr:hypothetical protein [Pyrinomonadaceae bacterium]
MKHHPAWLAAGLILCVVLACNLGKKTNVNTNVNSSATPDTSDVDLGSGVYTSEAHMAKDNGSGRPGNTTEAFTADEHTIHCVTTLKAAKAGTLIRFAWWETDVGSNHNKKIQEISYTTVGRDRLIHGHLTAQQDWAVGKYKVQIYINGDLDRTVFFSVR